MEQVIITKLDELSHGEFIEAEVVVDHGSRFEKSLPFMISREHKVKTFPKPEQFMEYVKRMGKAMIAQCGDARNPFPEQIIEGRT